MAHNDGIWDKQIERYAVNKVINGLFLTLDEVKQYQDNCINKKKFKLSNDKKLLFQELYNMAESSMTKADKKLYKEVLKEL
jgi:hypothetical protein